MPKLKIFSYEILLVNFIFFKKKKNSHILSLTYCRNGNGLFISEQWCWKSIPIKSKPISKVRQWLQSICSMPILQNASLQHLPISINKRSKQEKEKWCALMEKRIYDSCANFLFEKRKSNYEIMANSDDKER